MKQNKNFLIKNNILKMIWVVILCVCVLVSVFLVRAEVNAKDNAEKVPDWYSVYENPESIKYESSSKEFKDAPGVKKMDSIAKKFAGIAVGISMAFATITIAYSGYEYMTAGSEPSKVYGAKMRILYTMVGLAIVVLASTLIELFARVVGL